MKIKPSEMNDIRQANKRIKRLYRERHWTFTRRKKQYQKILWKWGYGKNEN